CSKTCGGAPPSGLAGLRFVSYAEAPALRRDSHLDHGSLNTSAPNSRSDRDTGRKERRQYAALSRQCIALLPGQAREDCGERTISRARAGETRRESRSRTPRTRSGHRPPCASAFGVLL